MAKNEALARDVDVLRAQNEVLIEAELLVDLFLTLMIRLGIKIRQPEVLELFAALAYDRMESANAPHDAKIEELLDLMIEVTRR